MTELIIVDDTNTVRRFPILNDEVIIGRSDDSDVTIDDSLISRYHAKVVVSYSIKDMDSTNGIWKLGKRISQSKLTTEGDLFLGKSNRYQIRIEPGVKKEAEKEEVEPTPEPEPEPEPEPTPAPVPKIPEPKPINNEELETLKKDLSQRDQLIDEMKSKYSQLRESCVLLEKKVEQMKDENKFLRSSLYPDAPQEEEEDVKIEIPDLPDTPPPSPVETPKKERPTVTQAPIAAAPMDEGFLRKLIQVFVPQKNLPDQLPDSAEADLLFALETLQKWGYDLERVTTRVAQMYSGVLAPMQTMLPEAQDNISSLMKAILTRGGAGAKEELESYLLRLRTWYVACLGGYKKAMERWCPKFLNDLSPSAIQKKHQYNALLRFLGMADFFYWRDYKVTMRNMDVPTVIEEFEEYAAQAALEIANKDQKDPLGQSASS